MIDPAARRSGKISVPVGYKFSPTDGDLINHHFKRKLMNLPEQHCLIPDHNHYEAEPWDLITKYNELSDGESNDDECFFFCTNSSSQRVHRKTPKGRWHETSKKKTIQGSDGVQYVMKYFTFDNGHQKKRNITPWRMREFTHPSNKELALCKIFKDVDSQNKKKGGPTSVIPEPSTSVNQTPEAYTDMAKEARTPTSVNLANNLVSPQWQQNSFNETPLSDANLMIYDISSPHPMPIEERNLPSHNAFADQLLYFNDSRQCDQLLDPNLMMNGVISPHHQQLTHTKEGTPLAQNIPNDEYNKDELYSQYVTPNIGDVYSKRPHMAEGTNLETTQQPPTKKSRILVTNSQNLELPPSNFGYPFQQTQMDRERNFSSTNNSPFNSSMSFPHGNNMLTGYGSEEVNSEEVASLVNPPTQPRNPDSLNYMVSSQHQLQVPQSHQIIGPIPYSHNMRQQIDIEESTSFDDTLTNFLANILANSDDKVNTSDPTSIENDESQQPIQQQEFLTWQSNGISHDDILITNGTNIEGHSNESTVSLSPSNYSTYGQVNTSGPTGIENRDAQQPIQQQALHGLFSLPQSPTRPLNSGLPCSNTATQQMDMPIISEDCRFSDIDDDHQYLFESIMTYSPQLV